MIGGMIERVLLVAWKGSTATGWVDELRGGGYTVLLEDTTGERAWRTAKERGIDCVIIDGQKKPSHGRQTGHALRDTAKTREIPIIWTNLDPEDAAGVQTDVRPDRTLPAPTDAAGALMALHSLVGEQKAPASAANVPATKAAEPAVLAPPAKPRAAAKTAKATKVSKSAPAKKAAKKPTPKAVKKAKAPARRTAARGK